MRRAAQIVLQIVGERDGNARDRAPPRSASGAPFCGVGDDVARPAAVRLFEDRDAIVNDRDLLRGHAACRSAPLLTNSETAM